MGFKLGDQYEVLLTEVSNPSGQGRDNHWFHHANFDNNGRLHVWSLAHGKAGAGGMPTYAVYVYSDDFGETYHKLDGTSVELPLSTQSDDPKKPDIAWSFDVPTWPWPMAAMALPNGDFLGFVALEKDGPWHTILGHDGTWTEVDIPDLLRPYEYDTPTTVYDREGNPALLSQRGIERFYIKDDGSVGVTQFHNQVEDRSMNPDMKYFRLTGKILAYQNTRADPGRVQVVDLVDTLEPPVDYHKEELVKTTLFESEDRYVRDGPLQLYSSIVSWYDSDVFFLHYTADRNVKIVHLKYDSGELKQVSSNLLLGDDARPNTASWKYMYSIGIDEEGYVHAAGEMNEWPAGGESTDYDWPFAGSRCLLWRSALLLDSTTFEFRGDDEAHCIPGYGFALVKFFNDRQGRMYAQYRTWTTDPEIPADRRRGVNIAQYSATKQNWKSLGREESGGAGEEGWSAIISTAEIPSLSTHCNYVSQTYFDEHDILRFISNGPKSQSGPTAMFSTYQYTMSYGMTWLDKDRKEANIPEQPKDNSIYLSRTGFEVPMGGVVMPSGHTVLMLVDMGSNEQAIARQDPKMLRWESWMDTERIMGWPGVNESLTVYQGPDRIPTTVANDGIRRFWSVEEADVKKHDFDLNRVRVDDAYFRRTGRILGMAEGKSIDDDGSPLEVFVLDFVREDDTVPDVAVDPPYNVMRETIAEEVVFEMPSDQVSRTNGMTQWANAIASWGEDHIFMVYLAAGRKPKVMHLEYKDGTATKVSDIFLVNEDHKTSEDWRYQYSIGVDDRGYVHLTGEMNDFPRNEPDYEHWPYSGAACNVWRSDAPVDASKISFKGWGKPKCFPGSRVGRFRYFNDNKGRLYVHYRDRATSLELEGIYWARGIRIAAYDSAAQIWRSLDARVPVG
eukprot:Polyplicarium_translucidae@DN3382_c1_g5_i1.p1